MSCISNSGVLNAFNIYIFIINGLRVVKAWGWLILKVVVSRSPRNWIIKNKEFTALWDRQ